jgi:polyphosphate kinase 2 (PPK2 family)
VHDLVPKRVWKRRYDDIQSFERMLVDEGCVLLKFFLHISKEEQRKRLQARLDDPQKRWKFQLGDIEERKMWSEYRKAYEAVLSRTSTDEAPWYIVPANQKWYRDYIVGQTIAETLEALNMRYPEPDLSHVVIK